MVAEAPYQRKKTDLDPAALDAPVALVGAKTVGELVVRIAKATGVELYADRRIGALAIAVISEPGQSIRASATTVRRVVSGNESAFVLTFDRTPLAVSSMAASDEMMPIFIGMAFSARQGGRLPDVWDRLPRRESADQPESLWKLGEEPDSKLIPFEKLPPALAEQARKMREMYASDAEGGGNRPVAQTVTVSAQANVELLAPFWSASTTIANLGSDLFRSRPVLPPVPLPTAPKTRALQIALPGTDTERMRLLMLATERGFNQLLIPLSGDPKDDALFALLAKEAAAKKLNAVPTLCPLQPHPADTLLERDLSLTGRSATEMNAGRALGLLTEAMPPLASFFARIAERDYVSPEAAPLDTALKATGQKARLWAAPLFNFNNPTDTRSSYLSPWQGKLPAVKAPTSLRLHEHLNAMMESVSLRMNGQGGDEEPNLTIRWLGKIFEENKTESFVLDFANLPLKDTLTLLEASLTKK